MLPKYPAVDFKNDDNILSSPKDAHKIWGFDQNYLDQIPKQKFLFFVKFILAPDIESVWGDKDVSFLVKNADKPTISFDVNTKNQYNRKRLVQTGLSYESISMKFIDTVDDKLIKMLKEYSNFYYGDFQHQNKSERWSWDQALEKMYPSGNGEYKWGFSPPRDRKPENTKFFERAEIYQLYAQKYTRYDLINPLITSFNPDEENKDDDGEENVIQIDFMFEGLEIKKVHEDLNKDLRSDVMRWDESGVNEGPPPPGPKPEDPGDKKPSLPEEKPTNSPRPMDPKEIDTARNERGDTGQDNKTEPPLSVPEERRNQDMSPREVPVEKSSRPKPPPPTGPRSVPASPKPQSKQIDRNATRRPDLSISNNDENDESNRRDLDITQNATRRPDLGIPNKSNDSLAEEESKSPTQDNNEDNNEDNNTTQISREAARRPNVNA